MGVRLDVGPRSRLPASAAPGFRNRKTLQRPMTRHLHHEGARNLVVPRLLLGIAQHPQAADPQHANREDAGQAPYERLGGPSRVPSMRVTRSWQMMPPPSRPSTPRTRTDRPGTRHEHFVVQGSSKPIVMPTRMRSSTNAATRSVNGGSGRSVGASAVGGGGPAPTVSSYGVAVNAAAGPSGPSESVPSGGGGAGGGSAPPAGAAAGLPCDRPRPVGSPRCARSRAQELKSKTSMIEQGTAAPVPTVPEDDDCCAHAPDGSRRRRARLECIRTKWSFL